MKLRHAGFVISDMERSLEFYRNLLGLKIVKDYREKGVFIDRLSGLVDINVRIVKLTDGSNNMIELLEYTNTTTSNKRRIYDIGYGHLAFTVNDIDKEYDRLLKKDIRFNYPPQLSPDGKVKVTICYDPDDTMIELVEELIKN